MHEAAGSQSLEWAVAPEPCSLSGKVLQCDTMHQRPCNSPATALQQPCNSPVTAQERSIIGFAFCSQVPLTVDPLVSTSKLETQLMKACR